MNHAAMIEQARRQRQSRALRDEVFGAEAAGFGEPAWDMLLELFMCDRTEGIWIDALIARTGVEASTGRRYLAWLVAKHLAEVADGSWVTVGKEGRTLMLAYFERDLAGS